ncbi:beta-defensin 36-like [Orycteropus afer afer]|uniref:Beta-defensin n=1 Tax=Orycteropus afer afer TaxID=1230840 RepID=A0A8B6ZB91_ORYAF|nr:beta-defensin 36-like [Orycteropus afer afer]
MKLLLLTLAALLLLFQVVPGGSRKCWSQRGTCREKCVKNEIAYIFCGNEKLCCVKPKHQPDLH